MAKVAIIYFSGYGHTKRQAEAVHEGAASIAGADAVLLPISPDGNLPDGALDSLPGYDAVIFGSATYMGGPSWQFKKFADASSKLWFAQSLKDKLAAGFTNSASLNGDKAGTISYFMTLAMQHGMLWIGTGLMPSSNKANTRADVNSLGGFSGALAQSPADSSPEEAPGSGDLETARLLGARVAEHVGNYTSPE